MASSLTSDINVLPERLEFTADNAYPGTGQEASQSGPGVDRVEATQAALNPAAQGGGRFVVELGAGNSPSTLFIERDLPGGPPSWIAIQPAQGAPGNTGYITASGPLDVQGGSGPTPGVTPVIIPNIPLTSGTPLPAATTVDMSNTLIFSQTTVGISAILSNPTTATSGTVFYFSNQGTAALYLYTSTIGQPFMDLGPNQTIVLEWNGSIYLPSSQGLYLPGGALYQNMVLPNQITTGPIGTAPATVDAFNYCTFIQTTTGISLSLPVPSDGRTGHFFTIKHDGTAVFTLNGVPIMPGQTLQFSYDGTSWGSTLPQQGGSNNVVTASVPNQATSTTLPVALVDGNGCVIFNQSTQDIVITLPTPTFPSTEVVFFVNSGTVPITLATGPGGIKKVPLAPGVCIPMVYQVVTARWIQGGNVLSGSQNCSINGIGLFAGGSLGTAAQTVDQYYGISLSVSGAAVGVTFPSPSDPTPGHIYVVMNNSSISGTNSIQLAGIGALNIFTTLQAGQMAVFCWDGSSWIPTASGGVGATLGGGPNLIANAIGNFSVNSPIGLASTTVDAVAHSIITQVATGKTLTIPQPTTTAAGHVYFVGNSGSTAFNCLGAGGKTATVAPGKTHAFFFDGTVWQPTSHIPTTNVLANFPTNNSLLDSQFAGYQTLVINQTTAGVTLSIPSPLTPVDGQILDIVNVGTQLFQIGPGTVGLSSIYYSVAPNTYLGLSYSTNLGRWISDNSGILRGGRNVLSRNLGTLSSGSIGTNVTTVDVYSAFLVNPSGATQTFTLPIPSDLTDGHLITIANASSSNSFAVTTTSGTVTVPASGSADFLYMNSAWYGGTATGGGGGGTQLAGGNNVLINDLNNLASGTFSQASVDNFFGVRVSPTATGRIYNIPAPTLNTIGHIFSVTNDNVNSIPISIAGAGTLSATIPAQTTGLFFWTPSITKWTPGPMGAYGGTDNNTVMGAGAFLNAAGIQNITIFGAGSGVGMTNNNNTIFGQGAFVGTNNAGSSCAFGQGCAGNLQSGADNITAFGGGALNAAISGQRIAAFGRAAGSNHTSGTRCTYIGDNTSTNSGSGNNRTVIGADAVGGVDDGLFFRQSMATATGTAVLYNNATGQMGPTTSSRRVKKDIENIEVDTSKVYDLRPVSYNWIPEHMQSDKKEFGLIAEEVAEFFPEIVPLDGEGNALSVHYDRIVVLLLAELKKLRDDVRALQAQQPPATLRS